MSGIVRLEGEIEQLTERERLIQDLLVQLREKFKQGEFLEGELARIQVLDPIETPPVWVSWEVRNALDLIPGPHERKKRTTVLRIAEAQACGLPIRRVFKAKDTCNPAAWYGNVSHNQAAWREIPEIAEALRVAQRAAQHFYDMEEAKRLALRHRILFASQDRLAELSQLAVETLGFLMVASDSDEVRRKAAVDTLTHAAPETAPKSQAERKVDLRLSEGVPSMAEIANRERRLPPGLPDSIPPDAVGEVLGAGDVDEEEQAFDLRAGMPPLIGDNGAGSTDEADGD